MIINRKMIKIEIVFSIMTLSISTFRITVNEGTLSKMALNTECCFAEYRLC
jgi:hypothetical protein